MENDRPRWAPEALMGISPIGDESLELYLHPALGGDLRRNGFTQTARRLADAEVALAHARAEIIELRARAVLGA